MRVPSPADSSSTYSQLAPPASISSTSQSHYMPPPQRPPAVLENGDVLMPPPPLHVPQSQDSESPPGSRPASRGSRLLSRPGSRPGSRDPSQARDSNRPTSRAESPGGPPALMVDTKLKKRRSWLPGSMPANQTPTDGKPNAQAWLVTPRNKTPYDLASLLAFQRVSLP